ncbi:MAG: hypothetical protein DCC65_01625 [Planctomycetota bacterium]|nr:MAG: hypothetical protein DCC65_01625 [Planctomycetota bacterium]
MATRRVHGSRLTPSERKRSIALISSIFLFTDAYGGVRTFAQAARPCERVGFPQGLHLEEHSRRCFFGGLAAPKMDLWGAGRSFFAQITP